MARTRRTQINGVRPSYTKTARDGQVRNYTTRGRRVRGEVAERRAERQAARLAILQELADMRPLLTPELVAEAYAEQAFRLENARELAWKAEEEAYRNRLVESGDLDALFLYDHPAYAKWLERKEEREWMLQGA